jgi:hypothetical protein
MSTSDCAKHLNRYGGGLIRLKFRFPLIRRISPPPPSWAGRRRDVAAVAACDQRWPDCRLRHTKSVMSEAPISERLLSAAGRSAPFDQHMYPDDLSHLPDSSNHHELTEKRGRIRAGAAELEYAWFGPPPSADVPTVVFLHEGLGSLGLWKDFPAVVCARTGCSGSIQPRGPRRIGSVHGRRSTLHAR